MNLVSGQVPTSEWPLPAIVEKNFFRVAKLSKLLAATFTQ